ncbi:MAG: oligosaccharide flippase family protein [Pseudomonadota bacterium]
MAVEHKNIAISKKLVAINSLSSVAAKIVNFLVLMWVYQYLLARLPAAEFAVLPVVTSLMVFAPLFFSFFSGGISRYILDAYAKGDFTEVRRIVSSLFPTLLLASAVFVPVGLIFAANIEKVFNIIPEMVWDARLMLTLLVTSFAAQMVIIPFSTAYLVRQRYVELKSLEIARDLLRAALVVVLLLMIDASVLWVVVSTFVSEVAFTTVVLLRSLKLVPELRMQRGLFSLAQARELISFGMWTTVGRLGAIMYTNAATLLLNLYGTPVGVTSYHIGATIFRQMQSTVSLAASPLQPAITAMNALEDRKRLASTVLRGGRYALWASMAIATPLSIYADIFIHLYLGPEYSEAGLIIILFMIIFPFSHSTALLPITSTAMAKVREFCLPAFLFQLAGLVLMLIFLRIFGMGAVGVAAALTLITIIAQLSYFWGFCLKLIDVPFGQFARTVLLRGLTPAACGAVVWAGLRLVRPPEGWAELFAYSFAGGAVYLIVLYGWGFDTKERQQLGKFLQRS